VRSKVKTASARALRAGRIVSVLDTILKRIVMGRGLTAPSLVILIGTIGGTWRMGSSGSFIGSIILPARELMIAWIRADRLERALLMKQPSSSRQHESAS
jgi:predicted PurR-regulated permease PerM